MKVATAMLAILTMAALPAAAAPHRWTSGYGQGTLEAIIANDSGDSVDFFCPAGADDHTPGILIETSKVAPRKDEPVAVRFVIDGRTYDLAFAEIEFRGRNRKALQTLHALIDALVRSKAASFTVSFPETGKTASFALAGAREAFGSAPGFLDGCN